MNQQQRNQSIIYMHFGQLARALRSANGIQNTRKCVRWAGYIDAVQQRVRTSGERGEYCTDSNSLKAVCKGTYCKDWTLKNIIGPYYSYETASDWINYCVNCIDEFIPNNKDKEDRKQADAVDVFRAIDRAHNRPMSQPLNNNNIHRNNNISLSQGVYNEVSAPLLRPNIPIAQRGGVRRGGDDGGDGFVGVGVVGAVRRRKKRRNAGQSMRQSSITKESIMGSDKALLIATKSGKYILIAAGIQCVFEALPAEAKEDYILDDFCNHSDINRVGQYIFSAWNTRYSPSKVWRAFFSGGVKRSIVDVELRNHMMSLVNDKEKHYVYKFIMETIKGAAYDNADNIYVIPPPGFGMRIRGGYEDNIYVIRGGYEPEHGAELRVEQARHHPYL